ncbi:MAG TPA: threonine--tRNA ligase, partial [Bacteroidales bacterium]|nr:threonine--tRNA ligase [Bacteroidales bacterium]
NEYGIRLFVDDRNEKIGRKIRDNEVSHIPYMLVVGEKEAEADEVNVRKQGAENLGNMKIADFGKKVAEEVNSMINKW